MQQRKKINIYYYYSDKFWFKENFQKIELQFTGKVQLAKLKDLQTINKVAKYFFILQKCITYLGQFHHNLEHQYHIIIFNLSYQYNLYIFSVQVKRIQMSEKMEEFNGNFTMNLQQNYSAERSSLTNQFSQQQKRLSQGALNTEVVSISREKTYRELLVQAIPQEFDEKERKREDERIFRIQQLMETQRIFVRDVNNVLELIMKPLVQKSAISKEQQKIIFSSLPEIYFLNSELYEQLNERWKNYNSKQLFGDILMRKAPFFKIYSEYINSYEKGFELLERLALTKNEVNAVLKEFEENVAKKNRKRLRDYFISPFMRFTKYKLLIQEIVKKTDKGHPDYSNLRNAQEKFIQNVQSTNLITDTYLKGNKLSLLDDKFGNKKNPIAIKGRIYLFEEKLCWLRNQSWIEVMAYFFNNLILFTEGDGGRKVLFQMTWTQNCFIESMKEGKNIKNAIFIATQEKTAIIVPISKDDIQDVNAKMLDLKTSKKRLMQKINIEMIQPYRKQARENTQVKVTILGNEEMNSTTLNMYTLYILELRIENFRQNLFIRYSWFLDFIYKAMKNYPSLVDLDSGIQRKYFRNHTSKTIEYRAIKIQQTLQKVLNNKEVLNNPALIIKELNLKKNFYDLNMMLKRKQLRLRKMDEKERKVMNLNQILNDVERRLGRYKQEDDEEMMRNSQNRVSENLNNYIIEVRLMNGNKHILVIKQNTTVEQVCNMLSKKIGLTLSQDYRLFNQATNKECRVLDYDAVLARLFPLRKQKQEIQFDICKIFKTLVSKIFGDGQPSFVFKKYYYMHNNMEIIEYKKDLVRLELAAWQTYKEILECKYKLTFKQYCFYFALMMYVKGINEVIIEPEDRLTEIIPQVIYKKQNPRDWKEEIEKALTKVNSLIQSILKRNESFSDKLNFKKGFYLQNIQLAYQLTVNHIKKNVLYGSNLYFVRLNEDILAMFKFKFKNISHNIYMAINYRGLQLLSSARTTILSFQFEGIYRKRFLSNSVQIQLKLDKQVKYVFYTSQSFEIAKLIEYYQIMNQMWKDLKLMNKEQQQQIL